LGHRSLSYIHYRAGANDVDFKFRKTEFQTIGNQFFLLKLTPYYINGTGKKPVNHDDNIEEGPVELMALDPGGFLYCNAAIDKNVYFSQLDPAHLADFYTDPIDAAIKRAYPVFEMTPRLQKTKLARTMTPMNPIMYGAEWMTLVDRYCRLDGFCRYARWCDLWDDKLVEFIAKNLLRIVKQDKSTVVVLANGLLSSKYYVNGLEPVFEFHFDRFSVPNSTTTYWRMSKIIRQSLWDLDANRGNGKDDGARDIIDLEYDTNVASGVVPVAFRSSVLVDGKTQALNRIVLEKERVITDADFNASMSIIKMGKNPVYDVQARTFIEEP
jgi:hypothetical protein